MTTLHLYLDDSGTRQPDKAQQQRRDGMDYFALGGIIVRQEDIGALLQAHESFVTGWGVEAPLHSTKIRGRRDAFTWLGKDAQQEADFLGELQDLMLSLPILGIACVIDRPGYVARYADQYEKPWLLCKTAFAILVERAAKYAARYNCKLEIYFEEAGKNEDRAIMEYAKALRSEGMPFEGDEASKYESLSAEEFTFHIMGEPNRVTKKVPMIQIADLMLYPLAKGGYDPTYAPYVSLMNAKRVIDAELEEKERPSRGVKYSCFDGGKGKAGDTADKK